MIYAILISLTLSLSIYIYIYTYVHIYIYNYKYIHYITLYCIMPCYVIGSLNSGCVIYPGSMAARALKHILANKYINLIIQLNN